MAEDGAPQTPAHPTPGHQRARISIVVLFLSLSQFPISMIIEYIRLQEIYFSATGLSIFISCQLIILGQLPSAYNSIYF